MADGRFDGQVGIVTGGAGGLGKALATRLLADGARVVLVDRDEVALERAAEELGSVTTIAADVTEERDVVHYVRRTVTEHGRVDLFFNNAGVEGQMGRIVDTEVAEFDRVLAVNVRGVFLGLREVLRAMEFQQTGGAIVNTASIAGLRGSSRLAPYSTSKHAVIGLTRSAAREGAAFGVRVNAVAPGFIDTRMLHSINTMASPDDPDSEEETLASRVPLGGRLGTPEEVANVVSWLLSPEASYVTGGLYLVDAGVMS
jgi:NAD(P)-dependent dehydrogenase (short-subunit alcohol dehydrogenase family)